jgi:hypothetical protein
MTVRTNNHRSLREHIAPSLSVGLSTGVLATVAMFFGATAGSDIALVALMSLTQPQNNPFAFFLPADLGSVPLGVEKGLAAVVAVIGLPVSALVFIWRAISHRHQ